MERYNIHLSQLLRKSPDAHATLKGSNEYNQIYGTVRFYNTPYGIVVITSVSRLPTNIGECKDGIFALHIHNGLVCTGNEADPFSNAGTHYNPEGCEHPYHAGDMPPLFSADGYAFMSFLTNRFTIDEIVGKAIIIHDKADDFTTQPSGNSGKKIACGIIMK